MGFERSGLKMTYSYNKAAPGRRTPKFYIKTVLASGPLCFITQPRYQYLLQLRFAWLIGLPARA